MRLSHNATCSPGDTGFQIEGTEFLTRPALAWKSPGEEGVTMIETTGGPEWRERLRGQLTTQARAVRLGLGAAPAPGSVRLTGRARPSVLGGGGAGPPRSEAP